MQPPPLRPRRTRVLERTVRCDRAATFDVRLESGTPPHRVLSLAEAVGARRGLLVTTPTVADLYAHRITDALRAEGCDVRTLVLDASESTKQLDRVVEVCEAAQRLGLGRDGVLVAVGGGVISDIVTLAASLIRRGIGYVRVPTTLVGQVDAGIGIKGAVNANGQKSYLGCFYPPDAVFINPAFLSSLSQCHLRDGLAEIIKIFAVKDAGALAFLGPHAEGLSDGGWESASGTAILWRAVELLLDELEPNWYEDQTFRRIADFGHTFSPALESASAFSISHGEAVAVDMALSAVIGRSLGLLTRFDCERFLRVLERVGLPLHSPLLTPERCERALDEAVGHRGGDLNLVVPSPLGRGTFVARPECSRAIIAAALDELALRASCTALAPAAEA